MYVAYVRIGNAPERGVSGVVVGLVVCAGAAPQLALDGSANQVNTRLAGLQGPVHARGRTLGEGQG
jgi:hypothetical protein